LLPYFNEFDSKGSIDILTLNNAVDALDGFVNQVRSLERVE